MKFTSTLIALGSTTGITLAVGDWYVEIAQHGNCYNGTNVYKGLGTGSTTCIELGSPQNSGSLLYFSSNNSEATISAFKGNRCGSRQIKATGGLNRISLFYDVGSYFITQ